MKNAMMIVLAALSTLAPRADAAVIPGMTEEQHRKYRSAEAYREEVLKPFLDRQREGLRKVRILIAADEPEAEVRRELDELKKVFGEIKSVESRYDTALASFLTQAQRSKLSAARAARARKRAASQKGQEGESAGHLPNLVPGDEEERE